MHRVTLDNIAHLPAIAHERTLFSADLAAIPPAYAWRLLTTTYSLSPPAIFVALL